MPEVDSGRFDYTEAVLFQFSRKPQFRTGLFTIFTVLKYIPIYRRLFMNRATKLQIFRQNLTKDTVKLKF